MKPNLIFVCADQLRYQSMGYADDAKAQTPVLDALATKSVNLVNAVSGHPVCAPFRATLFTGKYTTSTGMVINEIRMNTNHRTFADVLNDSGYNTSYIGKWHMYAAELGDHYNPKNSFIPPGRDRLGFNGFFAAYNFHHDFYGEKAYYHLDTPEKIYCEGYEPDAQTDIAIDQIKSLAGKDKPFALFLNVGTPHDPWTPDNVPPEYLERFKDTEFKLPENYLPENDPRADNWAKFKPGEREELTEWMRVYYAMTANLDWNMGRLLAAIDELDDNTIVVFTSDHGELFGAHGRRAKNIFYEEAVRVPFLVRQGGLTPRTCDVCFNTVDIMPTLLGMMGLPVPAEVEGQDLTAVLKGEKDTDDGSLMMGTGPTAVFGDGYEWRAYRTKQFTYGVFKSDGKELLFDHVNDPMQMKNLADDAAYAGIFTELKSRMWAEMDRIGDRFELNSYYKENWIEDRVIMRTATIG